MVVHSTEWEEDCGKEKMMQRVIVLSKFSPPHSNSYIIGAYKLLVIPSLGVFEGRYYGISAVPRYCSILHHKCQTLSDSMVELTSTQSCEHYAGDEAAFAVDYRVATGSESAYLKKMM